MRHQKTHDELFSMTYKIETSERAWEFVRSVTGYGYDVKPPPTKKDKWEIIIDDALGKDNCDRSTPTSHEILLDAIRESDDPLDTLLNPPVHAADPEDSRRHQDDVSNYMKINSQMGGCSRDRSKERILFNRPTAEKLEMANRFIQDGNTHFKEQDFEKASLNYTKALLYYEYTFPDDDSEEDLIFSRGKLMAHLNLAAAKLNMSVGYRKPFL